MDNIERLMAIAERKIGILLAKRLFCVLLIVFEIDKKTIVEKLKVSRLTVKKYQELVEAVIEEVSGLKRSLPQVMKLKKTVTGH
ncbi:MAG: hypothetical protein LBP76_11375 [Treponema sp.]|jgi:hypothetical protein|nr:hypothetical protein [Treponema sp.]